MKTLWVYFWAYLFVALEQLYKLAGWAADQIDHNDYLAGALIVTSFIIVAWLLGAVQIILT